jgi:hypothetical protein
MLAAMIAVLVLGLGFFGLIAIAILANGWAFMVLWNWFMVPFFALPEISLAYALGVSMTVGFITSQYIPPKEKKDGKIDWGPMVYIFARPATAVVVGAIVKSFI